MKTRNEAMEYRVKRSVNNDNIKKIIGLAIWLTVSYLAINWYVTEAVNTIFHH